jgi:DNA-binding LacI/PurR family transcriptional regulator
MKPIVPTSKAAQNLQNLLATCQVGQSIPGQHDLARILGVSRPTVRGLLQRYFDQQVLASRRGHGTYLIQPVLKIPTVTPDESLNVGVVVLKFEIPWIARMIGALARAEQGRDVNLILKASGDSREREIELLSQLWRTGIRRIITFPSWGNIHNPQYQKIIANMQSSESIVLSIERPIQGFDIPCIAMDNIQTGYLLTNYLIERRHRKILIIGPFEEEGFDCGERLHGYQNALKDAGLPRNSELVLDTSGTIDAAEVAYCSVRDYLSRAGLNFTGVIGVNDEYAWGAVKALKEAGIAIPQQVSVVGIDNNREEVFGIPLTSMAHPVEKMARLAMKIVCNMGGNIIESGHRSLFSPVLIERESVAVVNE